METSQILLNNGLTFLAVATGIMLVVVGGFLIKLIIDLSKLAQNVDETTTVVRNELRPTLRELNESLHTVNDFMKSTDKGIDKGIEQGIEKGIEKERHTLITTMFKNGATIDSLEKLTGLDKKELEKILNIRK